MSDLRKALKGVFEDLKREDGFATLPGKTDPDPEGDPSGEGDDGTPETNDPDTGPDPSGEGDKDSKEYIKKLREEAKKKTQRAQKAEGERDDQKKENEGLKDTIEGILVHLKLKPETKPEDILLKAEAITKEADAKIRLSALRTAFTLEATEAGMQKDMVPMAFKDSDFSDFVVNEMEVEGMADHVTALKAKYPALFNVKLEDGGEGAAPVKGEDKTPTDAIALISDRTGHTVEQVQEFDKRKVASLKTAGKEPGNILDRWGISKHLLTKEL